MPYGSFVPWNGYSSGYSFPPGFAFQARKKSKKKINWRKPSKYVRSKCRRITRKSKLYTEKLTGDFRIDRRPKSSVIRVDVLNGLAGTIKQRFFPGRNYQKMVQYAAKQSKSGNQVTVVGVDAPKTAAAQAAVNAALQAMGANMNVGN